MGFICSVFEASYSPLHLWCFPAGTSPKYYKQFQSEVIGHLTIGEFHILHRFKINMFAVVPSVLHNLVYSGALDKTDLSSITNVLCGAAYLQPQLAEKLKQYLKKSPQISEGAEYIVDSLCLLRLIGPPL